MTQDITIAGRYVLGVEIASGGMGTVHLGRLLGPVGFARTVAIKRLHPQLRKDPHFVAMFLDEARLAARIRHPNVVATIDVVADLGEFFLIMDYVHGVSLRRLMRVAVEQGARLPVELAASIIVGALHGLHSAHGALGDGRVPLDIVHRDVSPQNIMVGSEGLSRVLDFGVAKAALRLQQTTDAGVKGKIAYVSPEQANGGKVGPWSDVYSTAIVFWEALSNRRLFGGCDTSNLIARFTADKPVAAPSVYNDQVSSALDEVLAKALSFEAGNRFASALEMAEAIEAAVDVAANSSVARWVANVVGAELDARADLITGFESRPTPSLHHFNPPAPEDKAPAPEELVEREKPVRHTPARRPVPRTWRLLRDPRMYALGGVVAFVVIFACSRATPDATPAQPSTSSEASGAVLEKSNRTTTTVWARPTPTVALSALPFSAARSIPVAARPMTGNAGLQLELATAASRPTSCDPPYRVDSRGIRHMRIECLR